MSIDIEILKKPLRALRSWPAINHPLTTTCRAGIQVFGWSPGPLARFLPRTGLVQVPLPDGRVLRMWSRADDDVTPQVYWKGWAGHEPESSQLFYECARSARTTVDIGAHVGYFALLAAHANPGGHVYAFEPHPMVYERLAGNARLNGLANLSCEQTAVGKEKGTAEFFHGRRISSSSSLSQDFMVSIVPALHLVSSEVAVVSLDDFVDEHGVSGVDLVKVDTETTENDVLRGMLRILKRDKPVIFCEILHEATGQAIQALLEPFGYRFFVLTGQGPVVCDHIKPHHPWRNFCFVPDSRRAAWER